MAMARTGEFAQQGFEFGRGLGVASLAGMQIEHVVREELACLVDDSDLAAGAQSGVDAEYRERAGRRREKNVVEIVLEDLDGFRIGAAFQLEADLALDGRVEQALPGVLDGEVELRRPVALCAQDVPAHEAEGALCFELDEEIEHVLPFAAADGEHAVRGDGLHRLRVLVVHLELFLRVDGVDGLAADDGAFIEHDLAQCFAQVGLFADPLRDDVARTFEGFVDGGDAEFGVDESGGEGVERIAGGLLFPEIFGEGFETLLARDGGLGAALGPVGQIEIFELGLVERGLDARFQLVGEFALFGDGGEDRLAAVDEVAEIGEVLFDRADLHFIEVAGGLFAVTRDEGDGAAVVEQLDDGGDAAHRQVQGLRNVKEYFGGESLRVRHEQSFAIVNGRTEENDERNSQGLVRRAGVEREQRARGAERRDATFENFALVCRNLLMDERMRAEELGETVLERVAQPAAPLLAPVQFKAAIGAGEAGEFLDGVPQRGNAAAGESRACDGAGCPARGRRRKEVQCSLGVGARALSRGEVFAVGLVDSDEACEFHDAALDALKFIAGAGEHDQQKEVDHVMHRGFRLADADGFNKDVFVARGFAEQHGLARVLGDSAVRAARR